MDGSQGDVKRKENEIASVTVWKEKKRNGKKMVAAWASISLTASVAWYRQCTKLSMALSRCHWISDTHTHFSQMSFDTFFFLASFISFIRTAFVIPFFFILLYFVCYICCCLGCPCISCGFYNDKYMAKVLLDLCEKQKIRDADIKQTVT